MRSVSYKVRIEKGDYTFTTVDYEVAIKYGRIEEIIYTNVDLRSESEKLRARTRAEKIMKKFSKKP